MAEFKFLNSIYKDLMFMIKDIVVKREDLARANASTESYAAWSMYLSAIRGSMTIYDYIYIPEKAIDNSNIPDELKPICKKDKYKIPKEYLTSVLKSAIPIIIDEYIELNDYYRMLNGQPDINQSIFFNDGFDDIPKDIPLHQLSDEYIALLEQRGAIEPIRKKYPDRYYLNYLGQKRISLVDAHESGPFEILYCPHPENERSREVFLKNYYQARRYIMTTCYNKDLFQERPMYDPIMGFIILMMAVKNTLVPDESDYLSYEEIIDLCLKSYGMLDFFKNLPFTYKKRLVTRMDKLLQYKGTDPVLVDVLDIFKLDDYVVNRYYLFKTHKTDGDGNPIFPKLDNGSLDYDNMYDLRFLKKDVSTNDIIYDESKIKSYESVTEDDTLWQLNSNDYNRIMRSDFNIMMSKYIGIDIAYDITAMMYEVNLFINMILNARANVATITTSNMYATDGMSDAYTMIVFMLALMAKRGLYDGNIIYTPSQIAEIYGWDINELDNLIKDIYKDIENGVDQETISAKYDIVHDMADDIIKSYKLGDLNNLDLLHNKGIIWNFNYDAKNEVEQILEEYQYDILDWNICYETSNQYDTRMPIKLTKPIGALTKDMLTTIYLDNTRILKWLDQKILETSNMKQLEALDKLKIVLYNSANTRRNFMKGDGTYAKTYLDMLEDLDPQLYKKVNKISGDDLDIVLLYVLEKLENLFDSPSLKYLFTNTPGAAFQLLKKYIKRAIEIFKASQVQLDSFNIVIKIGDDDANNVVRAICQPYRNHRLFIGDEATTTDEIHFRRGVIINDSAYAECKVSLR